MYPKSVVPLKAGGSFVPDFANILKGKIFENSVDQKTKKKP